MLHYEIDRASALAATEAFAYTFGAGYGERWGTLVVKRTQSDIIRSTSLEMHEVRHHLHNIGGIDDFLHCLAVYHGSFHITKLRKKELTRKGGGS
jgi:hypothetical protein